MTLGGVIEKITAPEEKMIAACLRRWDGVAKPLHSLGLLEKLTAQMGGIQGTDAPHAEKRRVLVFCADNGVVAQGVTQSDSSVTAAVAESIAKGCSNVNLMADSAGAEVQAWDVGMATDVNHPRLHRRKIAYGTKNLALEPAMTREQAVFAMETGILAAEQAVQEGCDLLMAGEMGIGNTTTAAALICALLNQKPEKIVGRGSGLSNEGLNRKIRAIEESFRVNAPDPNDPLDVLSKVGGFDIAAMCGAYLACAALHVPVILDGAISGAAALAASRFAPQSRGFLLASHVSAEPCGPLVLEALGLQAPICAGLALGEGTGAVALLPLLDMALRVYYGEHSFASIGVEAYREIPK